MVVRCAVVVLIAGYAACAARNSPPADVAASRASAAPSAPSAPAASSATIAADAPAPSASVVPDMPLPPPTAEEILSAQGAEYVDAAYERALWRDGVGCLAELDALAKLGPRSKAAMDDPRASLFHLRTHCLMLAGKCDAGRKLERSSLEGTASKDEPARTDRIVDATVFLYCQGPSLSPRDQLIAARGDLERVAATSAQCTAAYLTVLRLRAIAREDDVMTSSPVHYVTWAATKCFERAGDCASARRVFDKYAPEAYADEWAKNPDAVRAKYRYYAPKCSANPATPPVARAIRPPVAPTVQLTASDVARIAQARVHSVAADRRLQQKDGAGCLAELDAYDRSEPRARRASTSPTSPQALIRAQCLMLAGQCDAGKDLARQSEMALRGPTPDPESTEHLVDAWAGSFCRGTRKAPPD